MRKGIQLLSISLIFLFIMTMLFITGCDKGKLKANMPPSIHITSYEGSGTDSTSATLLEQSFQAKIYWNATDVDGTIKGFAFRVLDMDGNPIPTPGYSVIDETGEFTPNEVKAISPNKYGWALHYKPGASQTIPLSSSDAKKTIWTTQKYATINFPAADSLGNPLPQISKFEIICIDNRNAVSNVAVRFFNATSAKPEITLSTTKGNPDGGTVGTGLKLSFGIIDHDPFLTSIATHYEFAMFKKDLSTNIVTPSDTTWITTINEPKINEYKLKKFDLANPNRPYLVSDFNDEITQQVTETIICARAFDLAGIKSDVKTIRFAVKPGFRPQTKIYHERVLALGDYHFIDYNDDSTPEVLPYVFTGGESHFATPFFKDSQGRYTAVYSTNLKVTLRWGWHGEYGTTSPAGVVTTTDNPFDRKQDNVLDSLDTNYYSEIIGFDLRFDNQPYNFPPLANNPANIITDLDGKRWLRVKITDPIAQSLVMSNLGAGQHTFEVRAIDLQDEVDRTPAQIDFYLMEPIAPVNRHNVLILDDDVNNNSFCPDASVDSLYNLFVSTALTSYGITSAQIDRESITDLQADVRKRRFSSTDLQNYKLVIYHSDGGYLTSHLDSENDGLSLYLLSGGNMVISGGQNLQPINQSFVQKGQHILSKYFGIGFTLDGIVSVQTANSFIQRPWFIKGVSIESGYPDVNVELTTPRPGNSLILARHGLGPVSYITPVEGSTNLYSYGCKPVGSTGSPDYAPNTQELYDLYNGRIVAQRYITLNNRNRCYFFTFPLSFMKVSDTQSMFNRIFAEVYGAK
jgi:hypothetical protein